MCVHGIITTYCKTVQHSPLQLGVVLLIWCFFFDNAAVFCICPPDFWVSPLAALRKSSALLTEAPALQEVTIWPVCIALPSLTNAHLQNEVYFRCLSKLKILLFSFFFPHLRFCRIQLAHIHVICRGELITHEWVIMCASKGIFAEQLRHHNAEKNPN